MTILETERLILKPVSACHELELHELHCDPLIVNSIWNGDPPSLQDTREKLALYLHSWEEKKYGFWLVYEKQPEGLRLVGRSGFRPFPGTDEIEFGHCYSSSASGKGIAVEAGRSVFNFAFMSLELEMVIGVISPNNHRAIKVADKLGQRFVDIRPHKGKMRRYYELTRDEFLAAPGAHFFLKTAGGASGLGGNATDSVK